jgi:DNA polymerase V
MLNGAVLVGQLAYRQQQWWLASGHPDTAAVAVTGDNAEIWAVVTGLIRTQV